MARSGMVAAMVRVVTAVVLAMATLLAAATGFAARPLETERLPQGESIELVVFELEGCAYCQLFRRDIVPAYLMSPRAAEVPIRFVDVSYGTGGLKLDSPIDVVPTAVLARNNREAGRIAGYAGPDSFFRLMRHILGTGGRDVRRPFD